MSAPLCADGKQSLKDLPVTWQCWRCRVGDHSDRIDRPRIDGSGTTRGIWVSGSLGAGAWLKALV